MKSHADVFFINISEGTYAIRPFNYHTKILWGVYKTKICTYECY